MFNRISEPNFSRLFKYENAVNFNQPAKGGSKREDVESRIPRGQTDAVSVPEQSSAKLFAPPALPEPLHDGLYVATPVAKSVLLRADNRVGTALKKKQRDNVQKIATTFGTPRKQLFLAKASRSRASNLDRS